MLDSFLSHSTPNRKRCCSEGTRRQGDGGGGSKGQQTRIFRYRRTLTAAKAPQAFVGLVTMGRGVCWCLAALAPHWEEILEGEGLGWPGVWARMGIYKGCSAQEQCTSACAHIQASYPICETLRPCGHKCARPQGPSGPRRTQTNSSFCIYRLPMCTPSS